MREKRQSVESVRRAAGFAPPFPFTGEVTAVVPDGGVVTVREGGYTAQGAVARARCAAAAKFSSRKRRAGFYFGQEFTEVGGQAADFAPGFVARAARVAAEVVEVAERKGAAFGVGFAARAAGAESVPAAFHVGFA